MLNRSFVFTWVVVVVAAAMYPRWWDTWADMGPGDRSLIWSAPSEHEVIFVAGIVIDVVIATLLLGLAAILANRNKLSRLNLASVLGSDLILGNRSPGPRPPDMSSD